MKNECSTFNLQWSDDFFFVKCKEKAICLICQEVVAAFKEYNLWQNKESRHKDEGVMGASQRCSDDVVVNDVMVEECEGAGMMGASCRCSKMSWY